MQKTEYKPQEIESKWQEIWKREKTFSPDMEHAEKPFYNLMMFPYPSAEGLHVGNMYAFTGADVYGRYMRMQGNDVFEPIGLDGFGIHSENYALKVGKHPREQAEISAANFYRQLEATGNAYDWTKTLETYDPEYYRWTQWLFVQMFKKGLAYRKSARVNWCPSDMTVLADEQVIDGKCERDGAVVEKRELTQWFFKITEYADRLLSGLDNIDWPRKVKTAQENWIGKSEGTRLRFKLRNIKGQDDDKHSVEVFTTRPDTLFGATFLVISPELAKKWVDLGWKATNEVTDYITKSLKQDQIKRMEDKEKTGVNAEIIALNPVNNEEIPVWIANYVLAEYGTGAIMAVPAHDQRDFEFAKKYGLPIKQVIVSESEFGKPLKELSEAYTGPGGLVNSGNWDDFAVPEAMPKILDFLEEQGIGKREANYHLRDWLISRQRYWGPPIPMIFCKNCSDKGVGERVDMVGWYTVSEKELPVLLPDVEDWRPKGAGTSPLANHPEFYEVKCPECNGDARRETDVSDTFLDSAWYFLRYLSVGTNSASKTPYDIEIVKKWCPTNIYIGGAEHSVLHLLYVRFVTMVLHDLKTNNDERITNNELALPFEEPFPKFVAHGLLVKDGAKMSKSRGNVVVPDLYISKFGADTLRLYLMFMGPFKFGGDFRDSGMEGMFRFVKRVWTLLTTAGPVAGFPPASAPSRGSDARVSGTLPPAPPASGERLRFMHKTIKGVTEDIANFSYNTAIAKMMEWYNFLSRETNNDERITNNEVEVFIKLLAPFAPHMTEELFHNVILNDNEGSGSGLKLTKDSVSSSQSAKSTSIHFAKWPEYDEKYLVEESVTVAIQVNGKLRGQVEINSDESLDQSKVEPKAREIVAKYLENEPKNIIYIPGKIINFVI